MFKYKYYLDGYDFIVDSVHIGEYGEIIACGHYNDGFCDEANVESLEIVREIKTIKEVA